MSDGVAGGRGRRAIIAVAATPPFTCQVLAKADEPSSHRAAQIIFLVTLYFISSLPAIRADITAIYNEQRPLATIGPVAALIREGRQA